MINDKNFGQLFSLYCYSIFSKREYVKTTIYAMITLLSIATWFTLWLHHIKIFPKYTSSNILNNCHCFLFQKSGEDQIQYCDDSCLSIRVLDSCDKCLYQKPYALPVYVFKVVSILISLKQKCIFTAPWTSLGGTWYHVYLF